MVATGSGLKTRTNRFQIDGRNDAVVEVWWEPAPPADNKNAVSAIPNSESWGGWPADAPKPAIAPFDDEQAKEHQMAWAKYLGVPLEREIDLGDEVTLSLVLIPPGEFMMGSSMAERSKFLEEARVAEDPYGIERIPGEILHRVRITSPFWLSRHEVTLEQFRQFTEEAAYKTEAERDGTGGIAGLNGQWTRDPRVIWSGVPGILADGRQSCCECFLERRDGLLPMALEATRSVDDYASDRSRMGMCVSCRYSNVLALWCRRGFAQGVQLVRGERGWQDAASWPVSPERIRPVRYAWQRVGVVFRFLRRGLLHHFANGRSNRSTHRDLPRTPRWQLVFNRATLSLSISKLRISE